MTGFCIFLIKKGFTNRIWNKYLENYEYYWRNCSYFYFWLFLLNRLVHAALTVFIFRFPVTLILTLTIFPIMTMCMVFLKAVLQSILRLRYLHIIVYDAWEKSQNTIVVFFDLSTWLLIVQSIKFSCSNLSITVFMGWFWFHCFLS